MTQQTFTRKEVRELLKRQIAKSADSYGKQEASGELSSVCFEAYAEEIRRTRKGLKKVNVIKF